MIGFVAIGALFIATIGLGGSYLAVRDVAFRQGMGAFSKIFPIGVDAGIIVLLTLDLVLTWLRIPFPLLRPTAWLLTVATIAFNASASWPDPLGVGMHAVIPVLFVIISEAARHAIARLAELSSDRSIEKIRLMRWILAPGQTWGLWRRMQLWEIRSIDTAIQGEQARLTYKTLLAGAQPRRRRAGSLPPAAYLPLELSNLGVPIEVTYQAGLEAAGIEAGPMDRLLAYYAQNAPTDDRHQGSPNDHAQVQGADIAQRQAIAHTAAEPIAQGDLAQPAIAHAPAPEIAQPAPAQSIPGFAQVRGHTQGIAQAQAGPVEEAFVVAQLPERLAAVAHDDDLLRVGSARDTAAEAGAQSGIAQTEANGEQWDQQPVQPPQAVPGSRVSALTAATGPVVTQPTDDSLQPTEIPAGWMEGFQAFVAEFGRHPKFGPKETELADYLHERGYKSNKAGDGPPSWHAVRRYTPTLQKLVPAPTQQSLDLEGTLV
ncbi:DUF2637 domain-containing protein [Streptomyces kaniharaensis]|uniref:DUF2637 domain-containing protein n=1 Tax=Streptomyces kaniharaensis TaxID=212423 RepID=A0A6N7L3Z5_9ACTN|nr:DUF2637 domain-containing protein [Streptomyces kaniharaensis]MQS17547.1 DUF2637 domain-containing protein [Streptomyces kaniharaensis]